LDVPREGKAEHQSVSSHPPTRVPGDAGNAQEFGPLHDQTVPGDYHDGPAAGSFQAGLGGRVRG
jgi:hypothetical protein